MPQHEMRHLFEGVKAQTGFIDHSERLSRESIGPRRLYEPLSYYWSDVSDALSTLMNTVVEMHHRILSTIKEPIELQYGFWPSTQLSHAMKDEFTMKGNLRE